MVEARRPLGSWPACALIAVAAACGGRLGGSGGATSITSTDAGADVGVSADAGVDVDVSPDGATTGMLPPNASRGCGKPAWTGPTGQWVSQPTGCSQGLGNQGTAQCQAIPPGSVVPSIASKGSPEHRGWWVYVPGDYDASKPYKVIYGGAPGGDSNFFNAGEDGWSYNLIDNGEAILVGLDYDTYSDVPSCYDRDPQSNDFLFFPWLQSQIESQFCVDTGAEFYSGYSSGSTLGQQLDCAFPDKLRGVASVSGCEPGAVGFPGSQPVCVSKPTAAFFIHGFGELANPYACILPACARVLQQNGCSVTKCDPLDPTLTTPYELPTDTGTSPPPETHCVQFNGCPAEYPVVFCVTYNQGASAGENWGAPLLWDFMNRLAPPQ